MNIELVRTCYACPEQYDVLLDEEKIGYLRLRHGVFEAVYPDANGDTVYEDHGLAGDGMFYDEEERQHYLINAVAHLVKEHVLRKVEGGSIVNGLWQQYARIESSEIPAQSAA